MIIKKAKFKGFSEGKTAVRLVFAVEKTDLVDKDLTRIDQLNADIGMLSFQKITAGQTDNSVTGDESPAERIKTALYNYWLKCYPVNKTFEQFYEDKMQGYIEQINNIVEQLND